MLDARKYVLVFFALFLLCGKMLAQNDPTFGTGGSLTTNTNNEDRPIGCFLLPSGKILVVNESYETIWRYHFIRYNSDGSLDNTYGAGGKIALTGILLNSLSAGNFYRAYRQPDGKILLVGGEVGNGLVARVNEDGTLDTSFASGGIHRPNISQNGPDEVYSAAFQPDGKIIIGGITDPSLQRLFLLRYLPNGSLDPTFGNEGFITYSFFAAVHQIFVQSDGKIVTSGASARYTGASSASIRRFNADGSVDGSFSQINFADTLRAAAMQPDNKILIGEEISRTDSLERTNLDVRISRYNADGTLDVSFGSAGRSQFDLTSRNFSETPNAIAVAPDGHIIISVITTVQPNRTQMRGAMISLAKLSAGGVLNGKFLETNGLFFDDAFLSIYPDGRILTAFRSTNSQNIDTLLARANGIPWVDYKFRGLQFDFAAAQPADGLADPTVFRPGDSKWYFYPTATGYQFGIPSDILVPSDYIRDTGAERAVFRPSEGRWYISRNYFEPNNFITVQWGTNGDVPAPADFDGDGKSDMTVFRPSNGTWYTSRSSNGVPVFTPWGINGDKPVPGDYDGDSIDDVAVFRPSDGNWYILKSSNGQPSYVHFGLNGDVPVQEDYDGDGKTDIAVWRSTTGVWYRLNSSDGAFSAFNWGISTDVATPGDYDGDSKADIAVYRPTQGRWYIYQSMANSMSVFNWGLSTDLPLSGRY